MQSENSGVGADWCYVGMLPNSSTGLMPVQGQGEWFEVAAGAPAVAGQDIRITGHGTTDSTVPREWNRALKTHTGPYSDFSNTALRYRTDTSGGNSGSAVQDETTGLVIGVHTHGGCRGSEGANAGAAIDRSGWQDALAAPRGSAAYGNGDVAPPLYVSSDVINLMGTLDRATGAFGAVGYAPPDVRGLAWDAVARRLIGVDGAMRLWAIDPATGEAEEGALVTGSAELINGLAMGRGGVLYGVSAATGQLVSIDRTSGAVTAIGAPASGSIAGLAFNGDDGMLYATDDNIGATTLMRVDPATGVWELVGQLLGATASDCDGLAWCPDDGMLYTLDDASDRVLAIDPQTAETTEVGATGSPLDVDYGLACITDGCRVDLTGDGELDFFDFVAFQNLFAAGDPQADFDGDGELTFFDFLAFQDEFAAGCD